MNKTNYKFFFKYILGCLLFGSNGIVASFIDLNSYKIVLLHNMIGSALLVTIFFLSKRKLTFYQHKKQFLWLAVSGIALGVSWILLYSAFDRIGVSISSLLYYCGPVIVMALSPVLFKEKLTRFKIIGFLFVFCGILLVNGNPSGGTINFVGVLCGLLAAVMYAIMIIFNMKAENITGLENATLQLLMSFATVATFVGFTQGFAMSIPKSSILPILILGLLISGMGNYFYFSSIGELPVQTVAVCGYIEPLWAVVFSVIVLKEVLTPLQIVGAVMILGGAFYAEIAKKKA